MGIFTKKDSSLGIGKKITGLQAQLKSVEAQLSEKETEIEVAIVGHKDTDKLFELTGVLRGNIESRRIILGRVEAEYSDAVDREEHERKTAEFDQFGKLVEKNIEALENTLRDFVAGAKALLEKEGAFRRQYSQFFAIPGPAGINFAILPRYDIGFIAQALTIKPPINTPERAITTATMEAKSNLSSIRQTMRSRLDRARGALETEAETAPPSPEPIEIEAPKRPVDGGKLLYRQQRRAGIERLKAARDEKATGRDEDVRQAVGDMDAAADAADRRGF